MTEAEAIWAGYYARLQLLFANFANEPNEAAQERFRTGINQARTARDRALAVLKEVTA